MVTIENARRDFTIGQYTRRTVVRRELGRIRANSSELGRTPRELANGSPTPTPRRTAANVRRSTPNVRRSSAEFAKVRPSSPVLRRELANGSPENSFAGKNLTVVRGERSSWRTSSRRTEILANQFAKHFLENGKTVRYREQVRPPRTIVRREP